MNSFKDIYEEMYRLLNLLFTLELNDKEKEYYLNALKHNLEAWRKLKKQKIEEQARKKAEAEFKRLGGRYFNGR